MKRPLIAILMLLCFVSLVFSQKSEALIQEVSGTVEIKKGTADWIPAKAGDRIEEAVIISTGFKSMAILSVGSTTLMVRALTRMSVEALLNQDETETINLNLSTGRVRADVKPPAGGKTNVTVQTPMATASVRGTVFELSPSNIKVLEGRVSYLPAHGISGKPVMVAAGQESRVSTGAAKAMKPFVTAEERRSLPPLAGSDARGQKRGARLETPTGTFTLTINLGTDI